MFEIWVNELNPSIHLVKMSETPLPNSGGRIDWVLLGKSKVMPDVQRTVERDGLAEVMSVAPFDPNGTFGPSPSYSPE